MTQRIFTVREADLTIPLVARITGDIVRSYRELAELAAEYKLLRSHEERDPETHAKLNEQKQRMAALTDEIEQCVTELTEIGCEAKDLSLGLVDFPTEMDGRPICLCWQLGEDGIDFWHETTEGFAGRKPLPVAVAEE